jgi:hypothetical protein
VRRLPLLAVLVVGLGCGGESTKTADPAKSPLEAMMLRLSDLPKGFRYGDDAACGEVGTTEGTVPELDRFIAETRPSACLGEFNRVYGGEPGQVQTALFRFDSDADAERAWERRKQLFGSYGPIFITTERPRGEFIEFDSRGLNNPGVGETWRDGALVVAVYEEGLAGDQGRWFARDLAERQRRRIESPTKPVETQEDDREVGLNDPSIAVPIYWLGKEFAPEEARALPRRPPGRSRPGERGQDRLPRRARRGEPRPLEAGRMEGVQDHQAREDDLERSLRATKRARGRRCPR